MMIIGFDTVGSLLKQKV